MIGFERAAQSTGISGFIQRSGSSWTASAIVAEIVKWFMDAAHEYGRYDRIFD